MRLGLKVKIVNHALYDAITRTGCKTIAEFCRRFKFHQTIIGNYLNLKEYPRLNLMCKRLEDALGEPIHLLFPKELKEVLSKKKITKNNFYMHGEVSLESLDNRHQYLIAESSLEEKDREEQIKKMITQSLGTITSRERKVLEMRFGLDNKEAMTLEKCAEEMNTGKERIRQIEAKAMRKLRHPERSKHLKEFIE